DRSPSTKAVRGYRTPNLRAVEPALAFRIGEVTNNKTFDVAVVGAGVFGAWTAYKLSSFGAEVVLVDAYGPGNSRASSGGESRMIRMGYGPDQIYTRMAQRSLRLWQELFDHTGQTAVAPSLFHPTGILWLARE